MTTAVAKRPRAQAPKEAPALVTMTVARAELVRAVTVAARVAGRRATLPAWLHARLELVGGPGPGLLVTATDGYVLAETRVELSGFGASVDDVPAVRVDARALHETVRGAPAKAELSLSLRWKDGKRPSAAAPARDPEFVDEMVAAAEAQAAAMKPAPRPSRYEREEQAKADEPAYELVVAYELDGNTARFVLPARDAEDIPALKAPASEEFPLAAWVMFDAAAWRRVLALTLDSMAPDDSRPVLASLFLELAPGGERARRMTVVSADGFTLSSAPVACEVSPAGAEPGPVMLPGELAWRAWKLLPQGEPVTLAIAANGVSLELSAGAVRLQAVAVQGTYPDYRKLFPESWTTRVTVPAEAVRRSLAALKVVAYEGSGIVKVVAEPGKPLVLSAKAEEYGEASCGLLAAVEGTGGRIAFNHRYLTRAAAQAGESLVLEFTEQSSPGVFHDGGEWRRIVMPMYVQW